MADAAPDAGMALTQSALSLPTPYLLFIGDVTEPGFAKTAFGLRDWARDKCVGECVSNGDAVTTGLPRMNPAEAAAKGARSMVVAVANQGGFIPLGWRPALIEALEAGLDLVSGMHSRLADVPGLATTAERLERRLIDVRVPPPDIPVATGDKRTGKRLLTVGTDCSVGKKYTVLALERGMRARGMDADFRATGQTGVFISGRGVAIDAVTTGLEKTG